MWKPLRSHEESIEKPQKPWRGYNPNTVPPIAPAYVFRRVFLNLLRSSFHSAEILSKLLGFGFGRQSPNVRDEHSLKLPSKLKSFGFACFVAGSVKSRPSSEQHTWMFAEFWSKVGNQERKSRLYHESSPWAHGVILGVRRVWSQAAFDWVTQNL